MQNTLPILPGNPLRNVTGLARQIALPGEHTPLRFPSFPALERTAVIGFNQPISVSLPSDQLTEFLLFRQACYPAWAYTSKKYTSVVDYACSPMANCVINANAEIDLEIETTLASWTATTRVTGERWPGAILAEPSYLPYALLAADRGAPGPEFVYVPAGCNVLVALTYSAALPALFSNVSLDRWCSPGEVTASYVVQLTTVAGNRGAGFSIPVTTAGWYRVRRVSLGCTAETILASTSFVVTLAVSHGLMSYTPSVANRGQIDIESLGFYSMLPIVYSQEFANSQIPWYATRVTASAILGTNVSQVLNKSGTILGGRLSPAQYNAWDTPQEVVSNLHPAEKAYLPLETGVYTYCPPSTDLVFFGDYTLNTGNGAVAACPLFLLSNDSMYNKMYLLANGANEQVACTVSWHLEFRTSSSLFQIGLSGMTLEALHSAQLVLAETGFFFENEEHDGILGKVIATAKKFVPEAVGIANPAAGRMLQSMVARMSSGAGHRKTVKPKEGPKMPKTTSAANSGMLGAHKGKGKGKHKGQKGKKK